MGSADGAKPGVCICPHACPPRGGTTAQHRRAASIPLAYPAGWNIVAVTQRRPPFSNSPLYTLQAGDSDYEVIPLTATAALQPRVGYWTYFNYDTNIPMLFATSCEIAIPIPGGGLCGLANPHIPVLAGRWVMIGNPLSQPITVTGADALYTYDPTEGSYVATTTLRVGQGAFVCSASGGRITITPPGQ